MMKLEFPIFEEPPLLEVRNLAIRFGETTAVDLTQPDFAALARAFGVPVRAGGPGVLAENLDWAFNEPGPAMVVLSATLAVAQPTP